MSLTAVLVLVSALAAFALVVWRKVFAGYGRGRPELTTLSAKEQATVLAAAESLVPTGGRIDAGAAEAGLVAYTDRYVGRLPREMQRLVRVLFAFIEHAPWVLGPRCARLTRLAPDERVETFRRMSKSRFYLLRTAFTSIRAIFTFGYVAHAPVATAIGCTPMEMETDPEPHRAPDLVASGVRPIVNPGSKKAASAPLGLAAPEVA